jgi:hypothetical protein
MFIALILKYLKYPGEFGVKKGELKNEGLSCDVIENTSRKNVGLGVSCDVYENKRLILIYLRYV